MPYTDYKTDEIIVDILERMSSGSPTPIGMYAKPNSNSNRETIIKHIKEVRDLFNADIVYDSQSKMWKAGRLNFLDDSPLSAQEAVVLAGIKRNAFHYGNTLDKTVIEIADFFQEWKHAGMFQNSAVEDFKKFMLKIKLIDTAESRGQYVKIAYRKPTGVEERTVIPLRIANMEYYWYLIAIEKGKINPDDIRKYALHNIDNIELDEQVYNPKFQQDIRELVKDIHLGMNAFFKPYSEIKTVTLMIPESFIHFLERSPYFLLWEIKKNEPAVVIKTNFEEGQPEQNTHYRKVVAPSTDSEYRDIIPSIQKYMPLFIVPDLPENKELILHLRKGSESYATKKQKLEKALREY